jgi:beta-glucosidase
VHYSQAQTGVVTGSVLGASHDTKLPTEQRIDEILRKMTLEEKIRMCFGGTQMGLAQLPGVPRIGIPAMMASDGPRGVTATHGTTFPSGIGMAMSWNPLLMEETGRVIGQEARASGISVIFGPAVNIERDPLGGRFFEYMTEDPYLDGQLGAGMVRGIQSQAVASVVKHFAANNREENRDWYMSNVDERTLREIYLPGFKASVQQGGAWGVMTAANGVNGKLAATNDFLIHTVLKRDWGFQGIALTDFNQARNTIGAAKAGLDVGMPWGTWETTPFGKPLMEVVERGDISQANVDDKVRRILRVMGHVGLLDGIDPHTGGSINTPEHWAVARKAAEESLVLLKNDKHMLPLDPKTLRHVIVLGPNAARRQCLALMGGSSGVQAAYEVTPLNGIRNRLQGQAEVEYIDIGAAESFELIETKYWTYDGDKQGIRTSYYNDGVSEPAVERIEPKIDFTWQMASPDPAKVHVDNFHATFDAILRPPVTGNYTFRLKAEDTARFTIDGLPLIDIVGRGNVQSQTGMLYLSGDISYSIHLQYHAYEGDASLRLEWLLPGKDTQSGTELTKAENKLKKADAVIFVGGWGHGFDSEGQDRQDMNFPVAQQKLIEQISHWNPKTIVVLIHGSPFTMDWLSSVPAVLDAWYPGMEGGTAIAEALVGDIDPAGKLTFTWPKRVGDAPSRAIGTQDHDNVNYKEGVFLGYRYFDTKDITPQFPFGYGLSYADFRYSKLKVAQNDADINIALQVKNGSTVPGTEIVQIYVSPPGSPIARPIHELKAFARVELKPGEAREIHLVVHQIDLGFWDVKKSEWSVVAGDYLVAAGGSSRDIKLTAHLRLN